MKATIILTKDLGENGTVDLLEDIRVINVERRAITEGLYQSSSCLMLNCKLGDKFVTKNLAFTQLDSEQSKEFIKFYNDAIHDIHKANIDNKFTISIKETAENVHFEISTSAPLTERVFTGVDKDGEKQRRQVVDFEISRKPISIIFTNTVGTNFQYRYNNEVIAYNSHLVMSLDTKTGELTIGDYRVNPLYHNFGLKQIIPLIGKGQISIATELINEINKLAISEIHFNYELHTDQIDALDGVTKPVSLCITQTGSFRLNKSYYFDLKTGAIKYSDRPFNNRDDVVKIAGDMKEWQEKIIKDKNLANIEEYLAYRKSTAKKNKETANLSPAQIHYNETEQAREMIKNMKEADSDLPLSSADKKAIRQQELLKSANYKLNHPNDGLCGPSLQLTREEWFMIQEQRKKNSPFSTYWTSRK